LRTFADDAVVANQTACQLGNGSGNALIDEFCGSKAILIIEAAFDAIKMHLSLTKDGRE
jgi:hypothetical protein